MDGTKNNVIGIAGTGVKGFAALLGERTKATTLAALTIVHGAGHNSGSTKHSDDYKSGIPYGVMNSAGHIYNHVGGWSTAPGFRTLQDYIKVEQKVNVQYYLRRFNSPAPKAHLPVKNNR